MTYVKNRGFTLINVILSGAILIIAVSAAIQFRYHAALGLRKARMRTAGSELALMIMETWRGTEDPDTFEPEVQLGPGPSLELGSGPAEPEDYNLLGSYTIQWNDFDYTATLSSKDVGDGLRALNVVVAWPLGNSGTDKEYRITSYANTN